MIPSARHLPSAPCWVPPAGGFAPNRMFYWAWLMRAALRREKRSVEWYDFRSLGDGFNRSDRIWKDYGNGKSTRTCDDPSWRIWVSIAKIDSKLIFLTKKIHIIQTTVSLCHSFLRCRHVKIQFQDSKRSLFSCTFFDFSTRSTGTSLETCHEWSSWINQTVGVGPNKNYNNVFLVSLKLRYL